MNLVLLGMPGSGKGTQAERLAARIEVPHISTGDLFREAVRGKTDLGLKAAEYMERGDLVPDEIVTAMVEERLGRDDALPGFLLDGFPRNEEQADHLDARLREMARPLHHVLYLEVPAEEVVRRLSSRRVCESCGRLQPVPKGGGRGTAPAPAGAGWSSARTTGRRWSATAWWCTRTTRGPFWTGTRAGGCCGWWRGPALPTRCSSASWTSSRRDEKRMRGART